MASNWISYNELAWVDTVLAGPDEYEEECRTYVKLIRKTASTPPRTLLHLGSGAGGHDQVLKRYFTVTGVDLSRGMLEIARAAHPDISYIEGDMRSVRLGKQFDAVVIPDSIDYMVTPDDLRQAMQTAAEHLRAGGVLLIAAKTAESFRDNNFVYSGEKGDVQVTVFENNYINPYRPNTYEAALAYMIRRRGEFSCFTERHVLGLYDRAVWEKLFQDAGCSVQQAALDTLYDQYLMGDGEYPMTVFYGRKG